MAPLGVHFWRTKRLDNFKNFGLALNGTMSEFSDLVLTLPIESRLIGIATVSPYQNQILIISDLNVSVAITQYTHEFDQPRWQIFIILFGGAE